MHSGQYYRIKYFTPTSDYAGPIMINKYSGGALGQERQVNNSDASYWLHDSGSGLNSTISHGNKITSGNPLIGKVLSRVDIAMSHSIPGPDSASVNVAVFSSASVNKGVLGWANEGNIFNTGGWVTFNTGKRILIEEDDSIVLVVSDHTVGGGNHAYWKQGSGLNFSNATKIFIQLGGSATIVNSSGSLVGMRTYGYDI
jgi:hypothetical protein